MNKKMLVLACLLGSSFFSVGGHAATGFGNMDLTEATCCTTLSLPDTSGKYRQLSEFQGKVVIVSFGFTQCPDVCPTTLSELSQSVELLKEKGKDVQVIFVTLDPSRDTRTVLSQYVSAFNPSFIALRGSPEETTKTAQDFRVLYKKVNDSKSDNYSIEHTVGVYLFDTASKVRLYARSADSTTLLPEIKKLLAIRRH